MEGCTCESHFLSPYDLYRHKIRKDCPLSLPHRLVFEADVESCSVEGALSTFKFSLKNVSEDPVRVFRAHEKDIILIIEKMVIESPLEVRLCPEVIMSRNGERFDIFNMFPENSPLVTKEDDVTRFVADSIQNLDNRVRERVKRFRVNRMSANFVTLKIKQIIRD
jgi:hypothetical protein